ncbi:MAG: alkaline phosphatase family protein [Candidatus Wallbacteria bacterium]|nr:alkaline phosphatase family protein [Candidatus Wallbacteria bacterium]
MNRKAEGTRVFIVGIDGGTLDLIEPWAAEGKLPNLRRMMEEGVTGRLESTIHPLTPQAWASFLTGQNPGKHGIYDFGERVEGKYELTLATSLSRRGTAIWDHLRAAGRTCGIVNVPLTFPPAPVPGFMVAGMHTADTRRAFEPASLYDDVKRRFPDYQIDVMSYWYDSYDPFLEELERMHRTREALVLDLYRRHEPDLMVAVFVSSDRVCHALWKQSDLPGTGGTRRGWKYAGEIERVYRQLDRTVGQVLDAAGDSPVIAMSDHGFGALEKDVYLNKFLHDAGLLRFTARRSVFDRLLGRSSREPLPSERSFESVDWERTRAYSHGLFGNVYLNLKGREPLGTVEPGAQAEKLKDEISAGLLNLLDPEDGLPIVDRVYRREELYWGECVQKAPDLLVRMRDYAYITRGAAEFSWTDSIVSAPLLNHSGNHRVDGIFIARGGPFRRGTRLDRAHIMDVAPTALHLMGIEIPGEIDGVVLEPALDAGWLAEHPIRRRPAAPGSAASGPGPTPATSEELTELRKHLRGLGYFR